MVAALSAKDGPTTPLEDVLVYFVLFLLSTLAATIGLIVFWQDIALRSSIVA